ncbi:MAG: methionine--tRNA ligase [Microgenomates group bacterium]
MSKHKYITTTLPYVNADPHIGFALEIVQADVIARSWKQQGYEVVFNTGTDEHGQKIYQKALEAGKDTKAYCDEYAKKFDNLKDALNLSYTHFIRTTDEHHIKAAQEFWNRCLTHGDIYKKNYQTKYCVGCELEKTDSELVDGQCPLHPKNTIELRNEENYFFAFSKFQKPLLDLYEANKQFVLPESKFNEIKQFVSGGLQDFSISRLKEKMPWGIPVPNDPLHVMYVWFDALINYISTVNWPDEQWKNWWPGIQVAGKDNLRQQSAMWQAMLLSAQVPLSQQIIIHGFITANGQKMSKSLGNVVNPFDVIKKYGTDAVRYYLLREIPTLDDGNFSETRMKELYNADLANELGNCVSRITTLAATDALVVENDNSPLVEDITHIEKFQLNEILVAIWEEVKTLNKNINEFEPWNKTAELRNGFLVESVKKLNSIGVRLIPFLPTTAGLIVKGTNGIIQKVPPLFPRLAK